MSDTPEPGRLFDDFTKARVGVYDQVLSAAQTIKPVEYGGRRVEVLDVGYDPADDDDDENERFGFDSQAKAVRDRTTLGRRLRATVRMSDLATGDVLEEQRKLMAVVPRVNEDGTMIYRGSRYNVVNQQRLKPAVYGRVKKNEELEVMANPSPGSGSTHRYIFNPESSVFFLSSRNSKVPLVPLLRALGVEDDAIRAAWGDEIAEKNFAKRDGGSLDKLYERLVPKKLQEPHATPEFKQIALRQAIGTIKLDPWSTKKILGIETDHLTPEVILRSTAKTLEMSRGLSQGDDRDSLAFQTVHGVEDLMAERFRLDSGHHQKNSLRKALWRGNLKALPAKFLQPHIESTIFGSGLGIMPEYANPLDAWDRASRVTKLGEGGIASTDSVPMESRDHHSSHQGFIDPARTSECGPGYMEAMTDIGWIRLDELTPESKLACLIDGRVEFHKPDKLMAYDYDGILHGFRSKTVAYEVTPDHRMWTACSHSGSLFRFETAVDIAGKSRVVLCGGHLPYRGELDNLKTIASPVYAKAGCQAFKLPPCFAVEDWAEFMGWFLSEGSTGGDSYRDGKNTVHISQSREANPQTWSRINDLLTRMRLKFHGSNRGFSVNNTHLASYCQVFGTCEKKYIPTDIFEYPVEARRRFLEALMLGDGGFYKHQESGKRILSTASGDLAQDVQTLAFGLGYSINETTCKDKRKESYHLMHLVMLHTRTRRKIGRTKITGGGTYQRPHAGKVYCASVPGGLMYWRMPGYGGFWIGNSLKVGIDVNFAAGARKGSDGKVYTQLINARTGELEFVTPERASEAVVAFQAHDKEVPGYMLANVRGSERFVKPSRVDYIQPDSERSAFSTLSNLTPMKGLQPQNRTAMSARFLSQAVPLKNREAPWVQVAVPGTDRNESFEQHYADRVGLRRAPAGGQVVAVKPNAIQIETPDGIRTVGLHVNTPLGRKTNLVNTSIVQVGDRVEPGQPLATSNYTDQSGTMALGLNARVAYTPWGDNYEDAYTISQSFANRMASEHSYDFRRDNDPEARTSVNDYISALPREYNREQVERMDPDGVVRVGTVVKQGDPLVLSAKRRSANMSKRVSRTGAISFTDDSQQWGHDDPGIVTNVHRTKNGGAVVTVATASPLRDADKLAERGGNKGIVRIIPDDEMLQDQNGQPFDVVASDLGLISRKNDSRAFEALLGKIAAKTGKPYRLEEMDSNDVWQLVRDGLDQNGLSDTETVVDPTNGRKIPNVFTGVQYMLKLQHMAESKAHGRGVGAYSSDGQPAKGAEEGLQAKRFSSQELGAMVSHGAFQHLKEVALVRGQRNDEYWARFINGHDLPEPKVPMVYNKFLAYLKGMGVNPVRTGTKTKLLLLDDQGTGELAEGRTVRTGETVNMAKDLKPAPGGLFDPALFGGDGDKFASYELDEPIPHPMMEDALRTLMGVTKDGFRNILSGQQPFGQHGTGPKAIQSWLAELHPANELAAARLMANDPRKTKREEAIKKMRYLAGLTSRNIKPETLMIRQVPIIPPIFRPISRLDNNNTPLIDGMNLLYRDMIAADENHRKVKQFSSDTSNERLGVYDAVQAAVGLRQPLDPELERKSVTGIMARLVGKGGPKTCYDDKTEILTKRGWLLFADLLESDEVGTLNQETGVFEFQRPTAIHKFPYVGELFHFRNKCTLDLMVTPNHRNWCRKRAKKTGTENLQAGWKIEPAYATAARLSSSMRCWMRTAAEGWVGNDLRPPELAASVPTTDFAEFVGLWAAEGYLFGDGRVVSIGQSKSNEAVVERIRELLNRFGWTYTETDKPAKNVTRSRQERRVTRGQRSTYVTGPAFNWTITEPWLADWLFEHVGKTSQCKKLSRWVLDWNVDNLKAFIAGFLEGDGSKATWIEDRKLNPKHANRSDLMAGFNGFNTSSSHLANQFQEVFIKLGLGATLSDIGGVIPKFKNLPMTRVNKQSSRFCVLDKPDQCDVVSYAGYVYCVTVPNSVVLVRRNRKPVFSGNSFVSRKLLSGTVDSVGRAVIGPDAKLGLDQVGIPEEQAWSIYEAPILRNMTRRGVALAEARESVKRRDKAARQAMEEELAHRPVMVSRAPVLHKYGAMTFWPKLVKGTSLHMNPLVYSGYGADNDGDAVNFHALITEEAIREAKQKTMPSRSLISPKDFKRPMFVPGQDHALGIYLASTAADDDERLHVFADRDAARRAFRRGEISVSSKIKILG